MPLALDEDLDYQILISPERVPGCSIDFFTRACKWNLSTIRRQIAWARVPRLLTPDSGPIELLRHRIVWEAKDENVQHLCQAQPGEEKEEVTRTQKESFSLKLSSLHGFFLVSVGTVPESRKGSDLKRSAAKREGMKVSECCTWTRQSSSRFMKTPFACCLFSKKILLSYAPMKTYKNTVTPRAARNRRCLAPPAK